MRQSMHTELSQLDFLQMEVSERMTADVLNNQELVLRKVGQAFVVDWQLQEIEQSEFKKRALSDNKF